MKFSALQTLGCILVACAVLVAETAAQPRPDPVDPPTSLEPMQTCACREEKVSCHKPKNARQAEGADGGAVIGCRRAQCSTYKCDYNGSQRCMGVKLRFTLERVDVMRCRKTIVKNGRTFLMPMEIDSLLPKPSVFKFRFAGAKLCWIYHGTTHKLDTEDPNDVVTLSNLPVGNCEPIKVKCLDGSFRNSYNRERRPGPSFVGYFEAGGKIHGSGVSLRAEYALSRQVVIRQADIALFGSKYDSTALLNAGFRPNIASPSEMSTIFSRYPSWEDAFVSSGKPIAKPVVIDPPYVTNQMVMFSFTPPYCDAPYAQ